MAARYKPVESVLIPLEDEIITTVLREKEGDVPESCHGDDGVPESGRNGGEIGSVDVLLCVEHDSGEDDDGHGQREDEEAQLGGAALERVAQDAEALRVPRKFENAEDAEDSQRHKRSCSPTK